MGVTMQQVPRATDRRGSLLVRRSIVAAGALEDAETSSSSGAWQPQDSILEVEPSAGSAPGDLSLPGAGRCHTLDAHRESDRRLKLRADNMLPGGDRLEMARCA